MSNHATVPVAASGLTRAAVERLSARLQEPAWVREQRLAAWEMFERLPPPATTHREEWRRTDTSGLDLGALRLPETDGGRVPAQGFGPLAREQGERAALIVHLDGRPATAQAGNGTLPAGVIFADLANAVREQPGLLREALSDAAADDPHRFQALHGALWSGGTFLYVPRGVEVALPFVAQTWLRAEGAAVFPSTLVVADEGSAVTLFELQASVPSGPRTLACGRVELVVRAGAQCRYVLVQEWGPPMWEVGSRIRARLDRDATLHSLVVVLGGGLAKVDVESHLRGPGASAEMLGMYFGAGGQHIDIQTLQEHQAPSTSSDLLYKGAVKDAARGVFAGLIRVSPGAQKTNAFQANRNLILSPRARSDSIPKLEIMANDLRCTHGSATSRLDEEQIFYLMSRGLSRRQATFMIVEGFFADIFDRIPSERLRAYLGARVAEKMI